MSGAGATGLGDSELAVPRSEVPADDEVVRTTSRSRPGHTVLLLGAILLAALVNLVIAWLLLAATTQVRDQYAVANGLQRCLINAQVDPAVTNDSTAYRNAVQACLKR